MKRRSVLPLLFVLIAAASPHAQVPDRALTDAMRAIYSLRQYTAFDWISAQYQKGTLTLQGFARHPQLKQQAEAAARKTRGIEVVDNRIEILPTHSSDDDIRVNAHIAIFGSSALERYAPGGQLSGAAISELRDSARFGLAGADVGRGPHPIHIIVSGARVLLLGDVRTAGDKQIAEGMVRSLPVGARCDKSAASAATTLAISSALSGWRVLSRPTHPATDRLRGCRTLLTP